MIRHLRLSFQVAVLTLIIIILCQCSVKTNHIVVYGDSRQGHDVHGEIIDQILVFNPKAVFHTGDLVTKGWLASEWKTFNEVTARLRKAAPFYPAQGNHEYNSKLYFDNFELPNNERWYTVDIDQFHFIILDTNWHIDTGSEQYEWLKQDLAKVNSKKKYNFVILHHPPFSSSVHEEDEKKLRQSIVPLFEQYKVDIVFAGHDHCYERLNHNGIIYIVTGGGGAPLYGRGRQVSDSKIFFKKNHFCVLKYNKRHKGKITLEAYDKEGVLLDSIKLEK